MKCQRRDTLIVSLSQVCDPSGCSRSGLVTRPYQVNMSEQEWQSQFYWFMTYLILVKINSYVHNS